MEVREREAAARWYGRVLGLVPAVSASAWAVDPQGPLILETQSGADALSLFGRGCAPPSRDATVAFRVGARDFAAFLESLDADDARTPSGTRLSASDVVDQTLSLSIYFCDPDGNRLELTTYETRAAQALIKALTKKNAGHTGPA